MLAAIRNSDVKMSWLFQLKKIIQSQTLLVLFLGGGENGRWLHFIFFRLEVHLLIKPGFNSHQAAGEPT